MFGLFKPKALIQVQRQTGTEEFTSITVNSSRLNKTAIYRALTEAGEALRLRMIDNNKIAQEIANRSMDPTRLKDQKAMKKENKHGK